MCGQRPSGPAPPGGQWLPLDPEPNRERCPALVCHIAGSGHTGTRYSVTTGWGLTGNSVVVATSSLTCSRAPPQAGQLSGTWAITSWVGGCGGAGRRRNGPCPGLRPGRFGSTLGWPLEKGAACRCCERLSRSISACSSVFRRTSSRIWAISSSRLSSSRGALGDKRDLVYFHRRVSHTPNIFDTSCFKLTSAHTSPPIPGSPCGGANQLRRLILTSGSATEVVSQ